MGSTNEHPAELRRGEDARRNWETINEINRLLQPLASEVRRLGSAVADLRLRPNTKEGGGGATVQRAAVISVDDDFIAVQYQSEGGAVYGPILNVAKPLTLRRSYWNGMTFGDWSYSGTKNLRTLTYAGPAMAGGLQPGDTVQEILWPPYEAATEIAVGGVTGQTNVSVGNVRIPLIDLNIDARRFVTHRMLVELCKTVGSDTVQFRSVIDGGPEAEA